MYSTIKGVDNVICGTSLSDYDIEILKASAIIGDNENILWIWSHDGWENKLTFDGALVGITTLKVFKYENNKIQIIKLEAIKKASHKKWEFSNGINLFWS
jgi:hypothetical protein